MKFRPLYDQVLLKKIPVASTTAGGLALPEKGREKPTRATVIAIGSGRVLENGLVVPCAVLPGDRVVVSKWSGTDVKPQGEGWTGIDVELDGGEFLVIRESEILGIEFDFEADERDRLELGHSQALRRKAALEGRTMLENDESAS